MFTLNTGQWTTPSQVSVPVRDYQYLIPDTDNLNTRSSLFLISLNHIVYIEYAFRTIPQSLVPCPLTPPFNTRAVYNRSPSLQSWT